MDSSSATTTAMAQAAATRQHANLHSSPATTQHEPQQLSSTYHPINSSQPHHLDESDSDDREVKIEQAIQEGHDADIPSNIGYVTDESHAAPIHGETLARRISYASNAAAHPDLEKTHTTTDDPHDPSIVWWDGPHDPQNPMNWPRWRKVVNCGLISAITFIAPLASSMFAPGVPFVMREFKSASTTLSSFVVSVYILGFAAGPLLSAPLSEIYGRSIVYHISNVCFVAFLIACALAPNLSSLIAFRFLSGIFGSTPVTIGGGSIADMIPQDQRAAWMAVFSLGPLMGPIIGPVVGGFVSAGPGWRWCFWILAIVAGVIGVSMFVFLGETYAPVLLARKTARLQKSTGNLQLRSKLDAGLDKKTYFTRSIIRPFVMLAKSHICQIFAVYIAVVYGYLYLMFTSLGVVFTQQYHFKPSIIGLTFLGLGIGSMLGLLYYSITSDSYMKRKITAENVKRTAANQPALASGKPEWRLPPLLVGAPMLPIGLFMYGWTAQKGTHWILPIIGTGIVGVGNLVIFMALQMYLVDAYPRFAASAIAGNSVIRSLAGALLPLAGIPMFQKLGYGWGNSLLGFIAVAMLPAPLFILKYGERMRLSFDTTKL